MASRERRHLIQSRISLWATPLSCALFLGLAWLIGRVIPVPHFVYWIIVVMHGLTWLGDLLNVLWLRRTIRGNDGSPTEPVNEPAV